MASIAVVMFDLPLEITSATNPNVNEGNPITSGESIIFNLSIQGSQPLTFDCVIQEGYKITRVDIDGGMEGGITAGSVTDNSFTIICDESMSAIPNDPYMVIVYVEAVSVKTVSSDNLARFKQKCDETYAAIGNIPTVSTELVNLGTLSTSGTLTTDQATQIGTTTVGVTARASVNSATRFYERVNISGTTAMLISADDDALHVLTVNLSTRAYTLSDVALGGGSGPEIPTPTTSDNGKVLGVANGAYALQEASGGGGAQLYGHSFSIECTDGPISWTGYLNLICSKPERFNTPAEIAQYFLNKGAVAGDWIPCNGYAYESSNYSQIIALTIVSKNSVSVFGNAAISGEMSITITKSYDVIPL